MPTGNYQLSNGKLVKGTTTIIGLKMQMHSFIGHGLVVEMGKIIDKREIKLENKVQVFTIVQKNIFLALILSYLKIKKFKRLLTSLKNGGINKIMKLFGQKNKWFVRPMNLVVVQTY